MLVTHTPPRTPTRTPVPYSYNTPPHQPKRMRTFQPEGSFHKVKFVHETDIKEMMTCLLNSCDNLHVWFYNNNVMEDLLIKPSKCNQAKQVTVLEKLILDLALGVDIKNTTYAVKSPITKNHKKNLKYFGNIVINYHSTINELFTNQCLQVLNSVFILMEKSKPNEEKGNDETLSRINQVSYVIIQPKIDIVTVNDLSHQEVGCIDELVRKTCQEKLNIDLKISNLGKYQQQLFLFDFMEKEEMKFLHLSQLQKQWAEEIIKYNEKLAGLTSLRKS